MSGAQARTGGSSEIRARLAHPVIDGDGHLVEIGPVLLDFLKEEGGTGVVDRYTKAISKKGGAFYLWYRLTPEERKRQRVIRPPFWVVTAIRAGLDHPVIDGDGHLVEIGPVLLDFLKDVAGPEMVQRYVDTVSRKDGSNHRWYRMTREERAIERESLSPAFAAARCSDSSSSTATVAARNWRSRSGVPVGRSVQAFPRPARAIGEARPS